MNWHQIKGNWKRLTGKAKEKWGLLTDDDLITIAGQRDQLVGKLQLDFGFHEKKAEKEFDDFAKSLARSLRL